MGVDHPCPLGKGIDTGNPPIGGVVGHIADAPVSGHGPGNGPFDELGPVQAGIIGAHGGVVGVQRAVEDFRLWVEHRLLDAGQQQLGVGGKDDVCPHPDDVLNDLLGLFVGVHIFIPLCGHLPPHGPLHADAPILVAVRPFGGLGVAPVDEGHVDFIRRGAQGVQKGHLHIVIQHHGVLHLLHFVLYLLLDFGQILLQLRWQLPDGLLIAKNLNIGQKGLCNPLLVLIFPEICLPEHIVKRPEGIGELCAPHLLVGASHQLQQFGVLARLAEN